MTLEYSINVDSLSPFAFKYSKKLTIFSFALVGVVSVYRRCGEWDPHPNLPVKK